MATHGSCYTHLGTVRQHYTSVKKDLPCGAYIHSFSHCGHPSNDRVPGCVCTVLPALTKLPLHPRANN